MIQVHGLLIGKYLSHPCKTCLKTRRSYPLPPLISEERGMVVSLLLSYICRSLFYRGPVLRLTLLQTEEQIMKSFSYR